MLSGKAGSPTEQLTLDYCPTAPPALVSQALKRASHFAPLATLALTRRRAPHLRSSLSPSYSSRLPRFAQLQLKMTATTMKAARYYGVHDIRIEDVPIPKPQAGQCKIKVAWCVVETLESCRTTLITSPCSATGAVSAGKSHSSERESRALADLVSPP